MELDDEDALTDHRWAGDEQQRAQEDEEANTEGTFSGTEMLAMYPLRKVVPRSAIDQAEILWQARA